MDEEGKGSLKPLAESLYSTYRPSPAEKIAEIFPDLALA